jgi:hypothetical protein
MYCFCQVGKLDFRGAITCTILTPIANSCSQTMVDELKSHDIYHPPSWWLQFALELTGLRGKT